MRGGSKTEREPTGNAPIGSGNAYALKTTLIYQDEPTRRWTQEVYARVRRLVGEEALCPTWWSIWDLHQPEMLAGAVSSAIESDVIVVAVRAASELPLVFYHWADMSLPARSSESGALVALIGLPEWPPAGVWQLRDYLRGLSCRGRLDFMTEERRLPEDSTVWRPSPVREPVAVTAAVAELIEVEPLGSGGGQHLTE